MSLGNTHLDLFATYKKNFIVLIYIKNEYTRTTKIQITRTIGSVQIRKIFGK